MNPYKCGGEVHLDYQQGDFTGQYWYAICNDCGAEYPLKSNNIIDAEREWNNRKEKKTMKDNFDKIIQIAKFIIEYAETYKEDEATYITETRINWISGHARNIVGMAETMECELGESEE